MIFLAFIAMVMVSYFYVSRLVRQQMQVIGEEMMNVVETSISTQLNDCALAFSSMVHTVDSMLASGKDREQILRFMANIDEYFTNDPNILPDYMGIYGYIDGEFLAGNGWVPPASYTPLDRPWYRGASNSQNNMYMSEPYVDTSSGNKVISFSQRVRDQNGDPCGIIAIDINLARILNYLENLTLASSGYGILISDNMVIYTHSNPQLISKSVYQAGGEYAQLGTLLEADTPIAATQFTDTDGTVSIAFFRTIFNGWHIGVVTPRSNYYQPVFGLAATLSILGLTMALILSGLLIRTNTERMRCAIANKNKSDFLAQMSHELRSPMNTIIGMTNIAQRQSNSDRVRQCHEKISEASSHMLGIINDIMDISKIEAGNLTLDFAPFSLEKMLAQLADSSRFQLDVKHQTLHTNIAPGVPDLIVSDQPRLSQVITCILGSTMALADSGSDIQIHLMLEKQTDDVCRLQFVVTGDGPALSASAQKKLFIPAEQAEVLPKIRGGSSMGMTISKTVATLLDGSICFDPDSQHSICFRFQFAAKAVDIPAPDTKPEAAPPKELTPFFSGKQVLLAEDIAISQEILADMLSNTGIQIDLAANGQEACEKFEKSGIDYDLIFMDIHMPVMNGYEATKRIRSLNLPRAKNIPIIAMTAGVLPEDIERCLAAGMNGHIGKPVVVAEVMDTLKKFLQ